MCLNKTERLILRNQYLILEKLFPNGRYSEAISILENGYTIHYEDLLYTDICDELSKEQCKEIIDILDMYMWIYASSKKYINKKIFNHYRYKFNGFDYSGEYDLALYTKYLLSSEAYEEIRKILKPDLYEKNNYYLNSHTPKLNIYRKMLEVWNKYNKPQYRELTENEILEILEF